MYRDLQANRALFRQRFIKVYVDEFPQRINELRKLVPFYERVFGRDFECHYLELLSWRKQELLRCLYEISVLVEVKSNFEGYRIDRITSREFEDLGFYEFDFYRIPLRLGSEFLLTDETPRESETLRDWIRSRLATTHLDANSESLDKESERIARAVCLDFGESIRRTLSGFLSSYVLGIPGDPTVDDILALWNHVLDWTERHSLNKDWILTYVFEMLQQFSVSPNIGTNLLELETLEVKQFDFPDFEFAFEAWKPDSESDELYRKRVRLELEVELDNYLGDLEKRFGNELKLATKPFDPDFESIKWLMLWNEGNSLSRIGKMKNRSVGAVRKAIERLQLLGLPVRQGKPGRTPTRAA